MDRPPIPLVFIMAILCIPGRSSAGLPSFLIRSKRSPPILPPAASPSSQVAVATVPAASSSQLVEVKAPSLAKSMASFISLLPSHVVNHVNNVVTGALQMVGGFLPLRGLASLAADLGIPGASTVMDILTPASTMPKASMRMSIEPLSSTDAAPSSPFREEMATIVGITFGNSECSLKLACLSGKRLSAIPGASAVTMAFAAISDQVITDNVKQLYNALASSVMYSVDCAKYNCSLH